MDNFYRKEQKAAELNLEKFRKKSLINAWLRGLIFLSTILIAWLLSNYPWQWMLLSVSLGISAFIYLVSQSAFISDRILYYKNYKQVCEQELRSLEWDYSSFDDGSEFLGNEGYLSDLDLFGAGSLFQYLNRTCTFNGKSRLAKIISNEKLSEDEIIQRQLSVVELSELHQWRIEFRANGLVMQENKADKQKLSQWLRAEDFFSIQKFLGMARWILPIVTFGFLFAWTMNWLPGSWLALYFIIPFAFLGRYIKRVNLEIRNLGNSWKIIQKYSRLLKLIENADFTSKRLGSYQYSLREKEHEAGATLKRLARIIKKLDNRNNMLIGIVSNLLYLSDIQYLLQLESWRRDNRKHFIQWLEIISEFDAYCSLASYAANNPEYIYPDISRDETSICAKELGHPLLHKNIRVCNNFCLESEPGFVIVTGANMAGKSTFLRTIGVNLLLAKSGAPVCSKSFTFRPLELFTSMRTSDSLINNQSYFFAELKRLKELINKLEQGDKLFIILDEVLKGTNSHDKALGSKALVKQLIRLNTCGLLATHDISLGDLENEFPDFLRNKRFEVEIENNELLFDYKLKDGISQNLNATFLMKKMGITIEEN